MIFSYSGSGFFILVQSVMVSTHQCVRDVIQSTTGAYFGEGSSGRSTILGEAEGSL